MLNEFISKVKSTGLAKTNRYKVNITPPIMMRSLMASNRLISLFCEETALPGLKIATTEHNVMGEHRQFPYMKNYDNVSMSFYIDNNFEVKGFFDNWLKCISDDSNKITSYYSDYISPTVEINVLPMGSEMSTHTVILHEAYPKAISNIELSASSRDVVKVTISMNYKYHTVVEYADRYSISVDETPEPILVVPPDSTQPISITTELSVAGIRPKDPYAINADTETAEYFALLATDLIQTQGRFAELYAFS